MGGSQYNENAICTGYKKNRQFPPKRRPTIKSDDSRARQSTNDEVPNDQTRKAGFHVKYVSSFRIGFAYFGIRALPWNWKAKGERRPEAVFVPTVYRIFRPRGNSARTQSPETTVLSPSYKSIYRNNPSWPWRKTGLFFWVRPFRPMLRTIVTVHPVLFPSIGEGQTESSSRVSG